MVKMLETNLNQLCDEQPKVNWIADPEQVAKWLIARHSFSKGINFQRYLYQERNVSRASSGSLRTAANRLASNRGRPLRNSKYLGHPYKEGRDLR